MTKRHATSDRRHATIESVSLTIARYVAAALLVAAVGGITSILSNAQGDTQSRKVFRSGLNLVSVDVIVRDKSGAAGGVRGPPRGCRSQNCRGREACAGGGSRRRSARTGAGANDVRHARRTPADHAGLRRQL